MHFEALTLRWSTPSWQMSAFRKKMSVHCISGYRICTLPPQTHVWSARRSSLNLCNLQHSQLRSPAQRCACFQSAGRRSTLVGRFKTLGSVGSKEGFVTVFGVYRRVWNRTRVFGATEGLGVGPESMRSTEGSIEGFGTGSTWAAVSLFSSRPMIWQHFFTRATVVLRATSSACPDTATRQPQVSLQATRMYVYI